MMILKVDFLYVIIYFNVCCCIHILKFSFHFAAGALGPSGVGAQSIVSSIGVGSGSNSSSSSTSSNCGTSLSGVSGGSGGGTALMTPMAPMAPVPPMMPPTQQPPPMASAAPQAAAPELPMFVCPRRPNLGREGRPIMLRANHFQISMPRGYIHHYDISIQPDKCPRKVNR